MFLNFFCTHATKYHSSSWKSKSLSFIPSSNVHSLFRKREPYFFIPHFSHCSFNFHSPKLSCCHFQSSSLRLRLIGRHHFLPAEKANTLTIEEQSGWGKSFIGSAIKLHFLRDFYCSRIGYFCSYWIRMKRKIEKHNLLQMDSILLHSGSCVV